MLSGSSCEDRKRERTMLRIYFGDYKGDNYIFNPDVYFDNVYEDEWMDEDLTKQMIKDVDGSEVVGPHLIDSPFLGPMSPDKLSGGVKTLILIAHDDQHVFNASACGDNCASWILRISSGKDVLIRLGHIMYFGKGDFDITIENTGRVVHNMADLDREIIRSRLLGE